MIDKPIDIIVLGSGPAGTVSAIGLRRLGYRVLVVSSPRSYTSCEGISRRTREGLLNAGCLHAVACVPQPNPRHVYWNGSDNDANQESLTLRDNFDQALLEDLHEADTTLLRARVLRLNSTEDELVTVNIVGHNGSEQQLYARFAVDARGRSAPGGGSHRMRGPETVSLLQHWQGPPAPARSMAASFAQGWAWMARTPDGQRFTQLTLAADVPDFPKKSALPTFFDQQLSGIGPAAEFYRDAEPQGELIARSSTAVLHLNPLQGRVIRVGDAAMATDPLSGNGIFNAVSTALAAPSVVNTLLQAPSRKALAMQFYNDRVQHTFERFARIGRDFYAMEQRWPDRPFWRLRAQWPDEQAAHADVAPTITEIARKPVLNNHQIHEREVVVTSDQPLGVWHVAGVELAPVLRELEQTSQIASPDELAQLASLTHATKEELSALAAWLVRYGVVGA